MIELVDRRRSDDVMSVGAYFFLFLHSVFILFHKNVTLAYLPGGEVIFYVWATISLLACLMCLFSLAVRSLELERAGLSLLATTILVYGLSGFMKVGEEVYPGQITSFLAFAMVFIMIHFVTKITRQISARNKMAEVAERNPTLKKGLMKEGG